MTAVLWRVGCAATVAACVLPLLVLLLTLRDQVIDLRRQLAEAVDERSFAMRRLQELTAVDWPAAGAHNDAGRQLNAQLAVAAASGPSFGGTGLVAPLHLLNTNDDGTVPMPPDTSHLLIEIGCSDRHTIDEVLDHRPKAFLIAFEPLLDKYAVLLARGTTRYHGTKGDRAVPLAHHHQRGVVLPLAVSESGGTHNFTVAAIAGCSSLRPLNSRAKWGPWCRRQMEMRRVPSITLTAALRLGGSLPVKELKIDAQVRVCISISLLCLDGRSQQQRSTLARCARPPTLGLVCKNPPLRKPES